MKKKTGTIISSVVLALAVVALFQNCSPVEFQPVDGSATGSSADPTGLDPGIPGNPSDPYGEDPGVIPGSDGAKTQTFTFVPDRKVDIILVIDNSVSMTPDRLKLAVGLKEFLDSLRNRNGIDWQICAITTDISGPNDGINRPGLKGVPLMWQGHGKAVLTSAEASAKTPEVVSKIFKDTLDTLMPVQLGGDERGIAALGRNVDLRSTFGCYRQNSVVAPIILSDEDVRSWGGFRAKYDEEYAYCQRYGCALPNINNLPLTTEDFPDSYVVKMRNIGYRKLIVSSIVVDNQSCKTAQEVEQVGGKVYKAYVGDQYMDLSRKTGGVINSICNANYSNGLSAFAQQIEASTMTFKLTCVPRAGTLLVTSSGLSQPNDYTATLSGDTITIVSNRPSAFDFKAEFKCN